MHLSRSNSAEGRYPSNQVLAERVSCLAAAIDLVDERRHLRQPQLTKTAQ